MSEVIYLTKSVALAVDWALTTARKREGKRPLLRKIRAGEIENDRRTIEVQVEVDGAKYWLTVNLHRAEGGWVVEEKENAVKILEIRTGSEWLEPEDLYRAAGAVFEIPSLEELWGDLLGFYSRWEGDTNFSGPEVLYDRQGRPTLIITETSGREIWLWWEQGERFLKAVRVVFPEGGSTHAAGQVIYHLRQMGVTGGMVDVRLPDGTRKIVPVEKYDGPIFSPDWDEYSELTPKED